MIKAIVTGGAGFIGSNLSEFLLNKGWYVKVIDNLSTGREENISHLLDLENFKFLKGDIRDTNFLKSEFSGFDYVFHQAAIPSVAKSVNDPITSNENNITGTLSVLVAARDSGVKRVIYAASSSVYGDTPTLPKVETMRPNPKSPYALTKYVGEEYCRIFYEIYGVETVCLRYFNIFGPKQNPNSQYAAVIPKFITAALNGERPVVFGDGKQTRDFTFIENVLYANYLASQADVSCCGKSYNIACGERISLLDLLKKIEESLNVKLSPIFSDPRPGDVKHSLADISLAKECLGYIPLVKFDRGLEKSIEWYREKNIGS